MARFIPDVAVDTIEYPSERIVYEALRGLEDKYVVLHSFPWLRPIRGQSDQPLREGEADFVVLHPDRGMLVLEVKGGEPQLKGRTWWRSGKVLHDPFGQARRSRWALVKAIEERTRGKLNKESYPHGEMVVFPEVRYSGNLPLGTDPRIFVDSGGVSILPQKVEEAFAAWTRSSVHLSAADFGELLEALMPKLRLMRCANAEISAEQRLIIQITLDQRATLLGLLENRRVLIEGAAGSGKTLLALEFALSRAEVGERVLFICYNRHLSQWLQEQAKRDPRGSRTANNLEITTFHSLARRLAHRAQIEFEAPASDEQRFWDDDVPLILEQSLEVLSARGQPEVFDAVVVDEAQDFATDWWVTIETLSKEKEAGRLYVFLDLKQSLRREADLPPVSLPVHFRLSTNCRNTKAIAKSGSLLGDVEMRLLPSSPHGEMPTVRGSSSQVAEAGLVLSELRQLLRQGLKPQQIALIGPTAHAKGMLSSHHIVDDVPLVSDAADWRRGGGVLVTTARAFKGLEADVVIAYGLGNFGLLFTRTDLYVVWTRARHRLMIFCQSGDVKRTVEEAIAKVEREALS